MRLRLAGAALIGLVLLGSDAFAAPTAADKANARALFDEGRDLAKDGKWAEACPKFEQSASLDRGIGTLFNLADCYEHVGRVASAWKGYGEVADLARRAGQAERESIAKTRAAAIAAKVPKLKLKMATPLPAGLVVRLDADAIQGVVFDRELPVDPGKHTVTATAPGKTSAVRDVDVPAAPGTVLVELPVLADERVAVTPPPPATQPPPPERREPEPSGSWHKPAAFGVGGAALVAVGVGAVFGLRASSQWSDAEASCPGNRCDDAGYAGWQDAKDSAMVSNIAFVAGAALAVGAVVLWVTSPHEARTGRAPLTPRVTW